MNRPSDLESALASVRAGSQQPHELIVSDDGRGTAREIAAKYDAIYVEGPSRGLGANRNAAIAACTGDLVAFIDDDVIVPVDFVDRAGESSTDVITSGWELNFSSSPARKVTPHNASFLGFQRIEPDGNYRSIVINATTFPRGLFDSVSFDEQIRYGYEEIDVAKHAVALGWVIQFNDDLWVEHHPSATNRSQYNASINVSRIYITHKSYARYDKKPLKAAAYNLIAAAHHVMHSVRNGRGVGIAVRTIREARAMQNMSK